MDEMAEQIRKKSLKKMKYNHETGSFNTVDSESQKIRTQFNKCIDIQIDNSIDY